MLFKSSNLWPRSVIWGQNHPSEFLTLKWHWSERIFVMSRNLRLITHTCEIFRNHPLNIFSIDWQCFHVVFKISNLWPTVIGGKIIPYIFWHYLVSKNIAMSRNLWPIIHTFIKYVGTQKSSLRYFFNWLQIKPGNCLVECCYLLVTYVLQEDKKGETEQ